MSRVKQQSYWRLESECNQKDQMQDVDVDNHLKKSIFSEVCNTDSNLNTVNTMLDIKYDTQNLGEVIPMDLE